MRQNLDEIENAFVRQLGHRVSAATQVTDAIRSAYERNQASGYSHHHPAVATGANGDVLYACSVSKHGMPLDVPFIRVLRTLQGQLRRADLKYNAKDETDPLRGITLWVAGTKDRGFDGDGPLYNFAPRKVVVVDVSADMRQAVVAGDKRRFLLDAALHRGMLFCDEHDVHFDSGKAPLLHRSSSSDQRTQNYKLNPASALGAAMEFLEKQVDAGISPLSAFTLLHRLALTNVTKGYGGPFTSLVKSSEGSRCGSDRGDFFDACGHAEVDALRRTIEAFGFAKLKGSELWTSSEPCISCAWHSAKAGVDRIYSGLSSAVVDKVSGSTKEPKDTRFWARHSLEFKTINSGALQNEGLRGFAKFRAAREADASKANSKRNDVLEP